VADLKKSASEGSSKKKYFLPFFKKMNNLPKSPKTHELTLNLDDFSMDNFYSYQKMNHSEKNFP